ncbi:MAG: ketopantoate reductase family protein [Desulfobulbus sp.]|jgi:2-dehydropantoate 2-reductase
MHILIIGAGALGGLFAGLLAPVANVSLYTTNTAHARAISENGLLLTGADGKLRRTAPVVLTDLDRAAESADLLLFCVKAHATAQAGELARPLLAPDGLALTLQNGLANLECLQAVFGTDRVMAGTTAQAATLLGPGRVRHAGTGPTLLGPAPGQRERAAAVAELFNRAAIPTQLHEDVQALLWSKLIVNVGINALAALLRTPNGALAAVPECDLLLSQAVAEAVAVAQALRIDLDYPAQLDRVRAVCAATAANRASMLQDILRGAPTEIDVINGAVVARGQETGVATPVNLLLTQLVKALEATASQRVQPSAEEMPCHTTS